MVVEAGENVHLVERRAFESDVRRHFVGQVQAVSHQALRVIGFTFVMDGNADLYDKLTDRRTRIFPLGDSRLVINVIPASVDLDGVHYRRSARNDLVVTDGVSWSMRINEFGAHY